MDAGATCFLLPKKHQSAWHRPDNAKRSTGLDGSHAFSGTRQNEWATGNPAERQGRGTGAAMGTRKKDWNISHVIEPNQRFPDRKMERQLSAFEAIPQYEYNFRAEKLPKAELKGAPRYDKFHLDMSAGNASLLRTASDNFVGFTEPDTQLLGTKMSYSTRQQLPIHPDLAEHHTIWNTGDKDWKISNQVLPKERAAAFDTQQAKATMKASKSKMRVTNGGTYKSPVELEALRTEEIRRLKAEGKFVDDYGKPFRHTYRMESTTAGLASTIAAQQPVDNDSLDDWDGEITFAKKRPGGVSTRTRWNYAATN
jgi:hypothetical protein